MADLPRLAAALADRYRIERELGAGGMATVYLAHDVRHDREVALKVLKPDLAATLGPERFLREIQIVARLTHPHILPLHDSGEAAGFLYYVMPFVEGESLRDRLERERQLSVEESVDIARSVAVALQYAHEREIVHRDIKPANILLHAGQALVADFGIALAVSQAGGERLTETGLSVGTPAYMSPEQATGERNLDGRTDIYSLGCVLYEMLAGEPPYTGPTAQAVIARVVADDPAPITTRRRNLPPALDAAIHRAIQKLPADRFRTAGEFAEALAGRMTSGRAVPVPGRRVVGWRHRSAPALAVLAGTLAVLTVWTWLGPGTPPPGPVIRYSLAVPEGQELLPVFGNSVAVSQSGASVVYVGPARDGQQLWLRPRDQLQATALPRSEGASQPFFAPDGERIGFVTLDRKLKILALSAPSPVTLVEDDLADYGGAWGADGYIYYTGLRHRGLMRIPAVPGAEPQVVTTPDTSPSIQGHGWPDVLPNGRGVLFTIVRNHLDDDVAVVDLSTGRHRVLTRGVFARYAASGHLIYVLPDGSLLAAPFDQDRLALTGPGVLIGQLPRGAVPDLAISLGGRLVYAIRPPQVREVVWVDRNGVAVPVDPNHQLRGIRYVVLSPDGTRLALNTQPRPPRDDGDILVKDLPQGPLSRLTRDGEVNHRPVWTPDGADVTFISDRRGNRDVWMMRADGSTEPELVYDDERSVDEAVWSRDGTRLVLRRGMEAGQRDLYTLRPGQDSAAVPFAVSSFDEVAPALSPDGRWLAFVSDRSGQAEVYVRPFPTGSGQRQVSRSGGTGPLWARNGKELFFTTGADTMVSVSVLPGSTFRFGPEQVLFSMAQYRTDYYHQSYDISADGRRFLLIRLWDTFPVTDDLIIVENWFSELEKAAR